MGHSSFAYLICFSTAAPFSYALISLFGLALPRWLLLVWPELCFIPPLFLSQEKQEGGEWHLAGKAFFWEAAVWGMPSVPAAHGIIRIRTPAVTGPPQPLLSHRDVGREEVQGPTLPQVRCQHS